MSNPTLIRLIEERAQQSKFIEQLLEQVEAESRDLVDAERANLENTQTRIAELDAQIAPLQKVQDLIDAAPKTEARRFGSAITTAPRPAAENRSIGQMFVESEQFRNYDGRGTTGNLTVALPDWESRAVGPDPLLTTTKPGSDLLPAPYKGWGPEHFVNFPLLSMCGRIPVSGNSVQWVTTTDASGVTKVAEGAAKPPIVWDTKLQTFTFDNYAGWYKFSRASVEDIPQLRTIIDTKMRRALDVTLAAAAATALLGGFAAGNTTTGGAGSKLEEQVRVAIAAVQARGINPNAVLVNPADHAAMDIAIMGKTLLGPVVQPALWGLPVYAVTDVPAKTAIVGNISEGLTWFARTEVNTYLTDSDISDGSGTGATPSSDFRHNILTALIEQRGAFAVTDAQVLQKVTIP